MSLRDHRRKGDQELDREYRRRLRSDRRLRCPRPVARKLLAAGAVVLARYPHREGGDGKPRPCLVVSTKTAFVVLRPFTTSRREIRLGGLPVFEPEPGNGLTRVSGLRPDRARVPLIDVIEHRGWFEPAVDLREATDRLEAAA